MKKNAPPKYPVIHTLADASQATDMPVLIRGNPATPGAEGPAPIPDRARGRSRPRSRRAAAGSSWPGPSPAPANPLTARVMVNRVWQHHFGRGLVGTASNFGALGERPEPPRAARLAGPPVRRVGLVDQGAAPRDHAVGDLPPEQPVRFARAIAKDPGNVLLWRMNRRRLDVEAWRDAMLAVAGRLDLEARRPVDQPRRARQSSAEPLYAAISRHDLAWMLRLFDFPDPNITSGGRVETTVPLQQLFVLNSEFMAAERPGRRRPAA